MHDNGNIVHTRRLANTALMLGHRLRRWSNIKTALAKRLVFPEL